MIQIEKKWQCNGCTACVADCPVQCISMVQDDEGFLYAKVDEDLCVGCDVCVQTCPIINVWETHPPLITLAAYNKNEEVCFKSTSGGIFTLLAEDIIEQGGVVFGAAFDKDWQVVITSAETKEDLIKFRTSKYVQASVGDSLTQAKNFLKSGRKVLYSGTPCQIAGLRHSLSKEYEGLITVDVACHGVPSPELWQKYLKEIREYHLDGQEISAINFRYKYNTWKGYRLVIKGGDKEYSVNRGEDAFMRSFVDSMSIREACYECVCKEGRNLSDITIGDYWGVENIEPDFENDNGLCLVTLNSERGKSVFPYEKVYYKITDLEKAKMYNGGLHAQTKRHARRDTFYNDIRQDGLISYMMPIIYPPQSFIDKVRGIYWRIRGMLSDLYHTIKK